MNTFKFEYHDKDVTWTLNVHLETAFKEKDGKRVKYHDTRSLLRLIIRDCEKEDIIAFAKQLNDVSQLWYKDFEKMVTKKYGKNLL